MRGGSLRMPGIRAMKTLGGGHDAALALQVEEKTRIARIFTEKASGSSVKIRAIRVSFSASVPARSKI
ncbi:MAG: hypothetical protein KIT22_02365 [Verrucomicrobiae bacterium]|nr:hypothetical protein [Verrucomicrobiae bacterium]